MRTLVLLLLLAMPAVAEHPGQWNLETTGLDHLGRADGVVVAVLDSGIDMTHPDLPTFWSNEDEVPGNGLDDDLNGYVDDMRGWDTCEDAPATDHHGTSHGTAVAGVIAADGHIMGIAPGAHIMHVRVLCGMDWGDPDHALDADALKEGIRYAVDNGARIVVMSLQGWTDTTSPIGGLLELEDTFDYAHKQGALLVAAAGNFGKPGLSGPSNQAHMLAVSATAACDVPASYSNRGGHIWAPGEAWTTIPGGHDVMVGTSFAAPLVAGAAALLLAEDSALGPDELRNRIMESARDGPAGPMLDGALFGRTHTPRHGSLSHARSITVGNIHYLQLGYQGLPAFIHLDVEGLDPFCYPTSRMVHDTFYVNMAGLANPQPITAAFYDRSWSGNVSFELRHDHDLPNSPEVPLLVPDAEARTQAAPVALWTVLALLVVLKRKPAAG